MQAIDWRSVKLAPFKKNFYDPSPEVSHRSAADVERFRTSKEITIIQVGQSILTLSAWVMIHLCVLALENQLIVSGSQQDWQPHHQF